jgi:ABC-2 type transport system permease protein
MHLDQAGYREWGGQRRSPWWSCLTLARVGLGIIFRRWVFWALIGLGLMNFVFHFAFIYLKATLVIQDRDMERFLDGFKVTGTGQAYADFMSLQGAITMLLLAFAGSALIGSDYRQGGMVFYLSRAIDRRHYIAGKLLSIASVVTVITVLPAIVLYIEYGMLSNSFSYFRENWRILVGILGYGFVEASVQSVLLFAIAAWVPRTVPLVMSWLGLFALLGALSEALWRINKTARWRLISLAEDMHQVGVWFFGITPDDPRPALQETAWVLVGVCVVGLLLIIRRVRAVEVVR